MEQVLNGLLTLACQHDTADLSTVISAGSETATLVTLGQGNIIWDAFETQDGCDQWGWGFMQTACMGVS